MQWFAPTEKDVAATSLEKRLWDAADQFRANSGLKAQEYSGPILGLIFLRFAEVRFAAQAAGLDNVIVQENDILLNITGASVARCALVPSHLLPARVNQHVAIVRADSVNASPFYVLGAINSDNRKSQLLALAQGGATREALTKDTIGNFAIIVPPRPLMERYDSVASGIHGQREVLLVQIQNLCRTCDLLLPRLLSGQIDVEAFANA